MEPFLKIRLNINLHKPYSERNLSVGLCQQNCKSLCIAVLSCKEEYLANRLCDTKNYTLTYKIPYKEENKLPPISKIQENDLLVSLRFCT